MKYKEIPGIGNYYGGLNIMEKEGRYYWMVENYDTDFSNISHWQEISKELYSELLKISIDVDMGDD